MSVEAVCFDLGETLVDETRLWNLWAQWLNISTADFQLELRAVIARRQHHRLVFERFAPGFDLTAARTSREAEGWPPDVASIADLYPDAVPCLRSLDAAGYRLGIAGNQPLASEAMAATIGVELEVIASSERWGVEKPSLAFFGRVAESFDLPPERIAYVGDRLDNDVVPAVQSGMHGVFIRRGTWGQVHADWPEVSEASAVIDNLQELGSVLSRF